MTGVSAVQCILNVFIFVEKKKIGERSGQKRARREIEQNEKNQSMEFFLTASVGCLLGVSDDRREPFWPTRQ